ncbi:MAG TPA: hypothetical protein VKU38_23240 [Ktedonobacteraceae bacterium]|nr:hypothetical protein [Ktedonobacteraceae bacterium]
MVIEARVWWTRWMLIIEHQLCGFVPSRFQEAHHFSIVASIFPFEFFATNRRDQTGREYFGFKVSGRATLGDWQVRCVTDSIALF